MMPLWSFWKALQPPERHKLGVFKFMLKVAESPKKLHIIAAKDTGTAEKNIINKDLGIIDDFGVLAEYNGNGTKDDKIPHILFHTSQGDKIVYVMGYGDKKKWQSSWWSV